jgi:CheY-like chemotaxis protein
MDAKRILVVDDNPASRELLRSALEPRYDVDEASDGHAALTSVRDAVPDLILLDIQMPDMDGYETLRAMRLEPETAGIPVIAITAFAMFEDRQKAFSAGFDGYLPKPINITALRMQIELLLKK